MSDAKNISDAQKSKEEYERNISTVKFSAACTKKVCSPHSGSILGAEGTVARLSNEQTERIAKIFDSEEFTQGDIYNLLVDRFDFRPYQGLSDMIEKVYGEYYNPKRELTEADFADFLQVFQNPPYHYGQRLRRAAGRGLVPETLEMIIRGCDPNTADGEGLNALHYAAEFNCVPVIRAIANITKPFEGLLLIDARCKYGWSPLYCAAHHGNIDCVELLLKLGASPAVANHVGKTPLHAAAAQGRAVIVDLMLTAGNSASGEDSKNLLSLTDKHGMTPLHEAAYKGQEKVYHNLLRASHIEEHAVDVMNNEPADYFKKIHIVH